MKRITFDGLFCDIAKCEDTPGGSFCETGTCSQRQVWERLKAIESILGDEYDLDHLRDLLQAKKDGLVRILPKGEDGTCGGCGHFKRIPGKRCGTCEVRQYYVDRRGSIETDRGQFTPSQSRKSCKQYVPRAEAEAALAEKGGKDHA